MYHKGKNKKAAFNNDRWHDGGGGMLIIKIEFHGVVLRNSK
jgi:hypothetical protein